MKYMPLFDISIAHAHYDDARCPDVRVAISEASEALVRRHRLIKKIRTDGVLVLAPVDDAGALLFPFAAGQSLVFEMCVENRDFYLFTDTAAIWAMAAPEYTNLSGQGALTSGALSLVNQASGGAITAEQRGSGLLSRLRIAGLSALSPSMKPAAFQVTLSPKSARWVYYVVTNVPAGSSAGEIQIVDKDLSAPVVFEAADTRDLVAAPDEGDPIATALAERYPDPPPKRLRFLRFVSKVPLASRAQGRKYLGLQVGDGVAQETLPNPSIRSYSRVAVEGSSGPVDAWYCVIEHMAHQGSVGTAV